MELADELAAHMRIEQDIFYPRVRELDEDLTGLVRHGLKPATSCVAARPARRAAPAST
jgi:hypothetical protein